MFSYGENVTKLMKKTNKSCKPTDSRADYRFYKRSRQNILLGQIAMTMNFHFIEQVTERDTVLIHSVWNMYIRDVYCFL